MAGMKLYTLKNLFEIDFDEETQEERRIEKIEIPIIQRDYAQGRKTPSVKRIRERFVSSLKEALMPDGKPMVLDFVYGYEETMKGKNKKLIPLDGQQRLTTLFLLYWYIARHEGVDENDFSFLRNFSYATRSSARVFCQNLVEYKPKFEEYNIDGDYAVSKEIIDQGWMPVDWMHDPTIASMLVMLDCIHNHFQDTSGLWQQLEAGRISFYFLPIKEMGLNDDLYIKMNSRGKPLTMFEHFKAEWEGCIKKVNLEKAEEICHKIDTDWTDLLWSYRHLNNNFGANIVDEEFLSYFMFLCYVIYYKNPELPRSTEPLDIAHELFTNGIEGIDAENNINFIEEGFDCWKKLDISIKDFFSEYLNGENSYVEGKVALPIRQDENLDLFQECCAKFKDSLSDGHRRSFTLARFVLLYSFVFYLINFDKIKEDSFRRRIRIIVNLVKASEFEIRDGGDTMKRILKQTEDILLFGLPDSKENVTTSFNVNQIDEEIEKNKFLRDNAEMTETVFKLEDHELLNGAIRVLGIEKENIELADRFFKLFNCHRGLVHCALLTIGDYSMKVSFRYEFGSADRAQNWRDLFRNNAVDIQNTREILLKLLRSEKHFTDDILVDICEKYIATTAVFDWRYYMVKYYISLSPFYGMFYWEDSSNTIPKTGHRILMMQTEKSLTGRNSNIFLKAVADVLNIKEIPYSMDEYAYSDDFGKLKLTTHDVYITSEEDAICVHNANGEVVKKCIIEQDNGIDKQDRVELCLQIISELEGVKDDFYSYEFMYNKEKSINSKELLKVVLSPGNYICDTVVKNTFIEAITVAGFENVKGLGLKISGLPLVNNQRNDTDLSQSQVSSNYWVMTHCSTKDKMNILKEISDRLNLKWMVKIESVES